MVTKFELNPRFRPVEKDGMIYVTPPQGAMVLFDNVGQALLVFETTISNGGYGGHVVYNRMPDGRIQAEITDPPARPKLSHYVTLMQPKEVLDEIKLIISEEKSPNKDRVNKVTVFEPFDTVCIDTDNRDNNKELILVEEKDEHGNVIEFGDDRKKDKSEQKNFVWQIDIFFPKGLSDKTARMFKSGVWASVSTFSIPSNKQRLLKIEEARRAKTIDFRATESSSASSSTVSSSSSSSRDFDCFPSSASSMDTSEPSAPSMASGMPHMAGAMPVIHKEAYRYGDVDKSLVAKLVHGAEKVIPTSAVKTVFEPSGIPSLFLGISLSKRKVINVPKAVTSVAVSVGVQVKVTIPGESLERPVFKPKTRTDCEMCHKDDMDQTDFATFSPCCHRVWCGDCATKAVRSKQNVCIVCAQAIVDVILP